MFDAELISIKKSLAVSMGFLSVVQGSYDSSKLFIQASLENLCVSGLGVFVCIYRILLIILTLIVLSPFAVFTKSRFLLEVFNSNSNPTPWLLF